MTESLIIYLYNLNISKKKGQQSPRDKHGT